MINQPKRLSRGKPVGGVRPAAPRAARHKERSLSVRVRPVSPPIGQLIPSADTNVVASDRLPSRKRWICTPYPRVITGSSTIGKTRNLRLSPIAAT